MARHHKPTEELTPFDHVRHELNTMRRKLMEETARADRAEATLRNQDLEIRRLKRQMAEAESKFGEVWSR